MSRPVVHPERVPTTTAETLLAFDQLSHEDRALAARAIGCAWEALACGHYRLRALTAAERAAIPTA